MFNIMNVRATDPTISTDEVRFKFRRVLGAMKAGQSLTLTYRRKPLARIVPIAPAGKLSPDDPLFQLGTLAEPMGQLTSEDMDRLIYGV